MSEDKVGRALAVFIGAIMMAVGLLIALVSGGCTLVLGWITLTEGMKALERPSNDMLGSAVQSFAIVFGIGGVTFAIGAVVAWVGWKVLRGERGKRIG